MSFLVTILLILITTTHSETKQKVIGNSIYTWGCNRYYQLGHQFPHDTSTDCTSRNNVLPHAQILHNNSVYSNTTYTHTCLSIANGKANTFFVTERNEVYGYGRLGEALLHALDHTYIPILQYNSSVDIVQFECSAYAVSLLNGDGEMYAWGSNSEGELGLGDTTDRFVPTFIQGGVLTVLGFPNQALFISYDNEVVYAAGNNLNYRISIFKSQSDDIWSFEKVHLNGTANRGKAIKFMFLSTSVFYFYEDDSMYVSGRCTLTFKSNLLFGDTCVTDTNVIMKLDPFNPKSAMKKGYNTFDQFMTRNALMFILSSVNGTKIVYCYAQNGYTQARVTKNSGSLTWAYNQPWPIDINLDGGEHVIRMSYSIDSVFFFLSNMGNLFAYGNNVNFGCGESLTVVWDEFIPRPVRVLAHTNVNITYIPPIMGDFHVALSINWKCSGILPSTSDVCFGHGLCVDEDVCECYGYYKGHDCQIPYKCFDYYVNDTDNVCSGNGYCSSPGICKCSGFIGEECEIATCFGVSKEKSYVCSGKGDCIDLDVCSCNKKYTYGAECEIKIKGGEFIAEELDKIEVVYQIFLFYVDADFKEPFDCSVILHENTTKLISNESICYFKTEAFQTRGLVIEDPNDQIAIVGGDSILVKVLTKEDEYVSVKIKSFDFWGKYMDLIILGGIAAVSFIVILLATIITLCACCIIRCQKRKLNKFSEIDDIDILLEESEAKKKSSEEKASLQINKSLFVIPHNAIKLIRHLGTGGSGAQVFKAKWEDKIVAFKIFKTSTFSGQKVFDKFEKEVQLISSIRHPNILSFFGCSIQMPRIGIITEFCENGTLKSYIMKTKFDSSIPSLSFKQKLEIFADIASCLRFLHGRKIIHRDIKADNVLLTKDLTAKLIDFGLSKIIESSKDEKQMTKRIGTTQYIERAPELIRGEKYSFSVDVYAFAILVYECLSEEEAYQNAIGSIEAKVACDPNYRPDVSMIGVDILKKHSKIVDMMRNCWSHKPSERPTFDSLSAFLKEELDNYIIGEGSSVDKSEVDDHQLPYNSIIDKAGTEEMKYLLKAICFENNVSTEEFILHLKQFKKK